MTLIGHAALGAVAYGALRPHQTTTRWGLSRRAILLCCLLIPMLPDADAVMHKWVKYGHPLGHRGISHSLLFALVFALGLAWLLQRLGRAQRTRRVLGQMSLGFFLLMASHGITDTMTTGGKAPMLLWPIKAEGVWFPERFIPVSPMGTALLRTKWTPKQLAQMKKGRTRLLRSKQKPFMLVRKVVSVSKRPDHYRRLGLLGIALTEILLLAPFALCVIAYVVWQRRRFGPAAKEPPRIRPPPQAVVDDRPARLWPGLLMLGITLPTVVVAGWMVRAPDVGLSVTRGYLDDEVSTHYRRIAPTEVDGDTPVAVLVHGWRCSHQMMLSMARALARNGVEVWAVDLPGHGRSPTSLETNCAGAKRGCHVASNGLFTQATDAILDHLFEAEGFTDRDVFVIGHSTGAVAAHEVSGQAAEALAGRIVIEGRVRALRRDGNRLIVGKTPYVEKMAHGLETDVLHGSYSGRDAVELFTVNRPHLELIYNTRVNAKILSWISDVTGQPLGDAARPYRKRQLAWAAALTALGLALTILGSALASRRGWLPPVCPSGYARPWVAFTCIVFGSIAAAMWAGELFRGGKPWLQAEIGQVLPTYLVYASVCIAIPYVALTRRPGRLQLNSVAVDAALAIVIFATIYLTLGLAADRYFFHLGLPAWRWTRALGWALAFVPISLVVQETGFQTDKWWARIATLFVHVVMWGALFWVEAVGRGGSHLTDAKIFLAIVTFAEFWALCVGWRRRSRLLCALVSSLVLAWVMTAVYPILSGAPQV